jgi:hypothetical protein
MIFTKEYRNGVQCVFTSCGHAQATQMGYHEFANYPPKPLCDEHYGKVLNVVTPRKKK